MEGDEESDIWCGFKSQHELEHEDVVVEGDEADDSYEVWVDQPTTVHYFE